MNRLMGESDSGSGPVEEKASNVGEWEGIGQGVEGGLKERRGGKK